MLIYSVTETADIAIAGYSSIVVLEICLPPNTEAAPKLTILATCLGSPPVGSRGKAPVGGLEDEVAQNLTQNVK